MSRKGRILARNEGEREESTVTFLGTEVPESWEPSWQPGRCWCREDPWCDWCGLTGPFRGGPVLLGLGPRGDDLWRMKTWMDLGSERREVIYERRLLT